MENTEYPTTQVTAKGTHPLLVIALCLSVIGSLIYYGAVSAERLDATQAMTLIDGADR